MQDLIYKLESITSTASLEEFEVIMCLAEKYGVVAEVAECFNYQSGWLFVGLDFAALEAKINALLTKDPEKMKIYLEGYDSHCLNTFTYWPELMPDIQQAEETDECYECIDEETKEVFYIRGTDRVTFKGTEYTGKSLYTLLTNKRA